MSKRYSVIGSWAVLVARALDEYGFDGSAVCREFGVDLDLARRPDTRLDSREMEQLWARAVELSGDSLFGLKAGTYVAPSTFHALSLAMWCSNSLKEALEVRKRFIRVYTTAAYPEIIVDDDSVRYSPRLYRDEEGRPSAIEASLEAALSGLYTFSKHLYGPKLQLRSVELTRIDDARQGEYEAFFNCSVSFGHRDSAVVFDRTQAEQSLPTGNPELKASNEQIMLDYLARFDQDDIVNRVRAELTTLLPSGEPSREIVAKSLHISLRSLQRKLQAQDTSFVDLLDDVRHEQAMRMIKLPRYSLGEISFQLGFANNSSFARAFKRWTGLPPGEFRQRIEGNGQ